MKKSLFIIISVAVALIAFGIAVDRPENWVFDPVTLQQIAQRGIHNSIKTHGPNASAAIIIESVIAEVQLTYPQYTHNSKRWFFNNAGGAMGAMTVLHASFSEYLIIFGTAVGTEGHTGRYPFAEDYFTILYGEQWAALPAGGNSKEIYKPGDQHYLPRSTAKQYRMPEACWALEYARGNIPSMLFFGFADILTSTLDWVTMYHTAAASAMLMLENAINGKI